MLKRLKISKFDQTLLPLEDFSIHPFLPLFPFFLLFPFLFSGGINANRS